MIVSNHIALNLVTKGLLNISNLTKGIISLIEIVTPRRKASGGSGAYAYDHEYGPNLFKKIKEEEDDISVINVHVDWEKAKNENIKIEVKLLKAYIEAEILKETGKNLNVEII